MVAGPEQARILQQFEENLFPEGETSDHQQHEQGAASQERFKKQVQNMFQVMLDMGNPFTDECSELLVLDTRNCTTDAVVSTVMTIEDVGWEQYQKYFKAVIVDRKSSIHEPLRRNNFPLFKSGTAKSTSKARNQLSSLKSDCNLFGRLYVASKFQDGDQQDFFSHENHPWPPSPSTDGNLY